MLGNGVFLDRQWWPHPDQWAFLSTAVKMERSAAETFLRDAEAKRHAGCPCRLDGRERRFALVVSAVAPPEEPPMAGPLPKGRNWFSAIKSILPRTGCRRAKNRLIRLAAFQNPEFCKAQAMHLPTYGKPRVIGCAEDRDGHLGLPRGCWEDVQALFADLHVEAAVRDERFAGKPLLATFQGQLRPEQKTAADALLAHDMGVLSATTAFGKTVVAAWLIAERRVNTLVLVHRRQLLEQWVERLFNVSGLPPVAIGRIGGGRSRPTGSLDVAVIQSLCRKGAVSDRVAEYGQLVVDECHHLSARSFEQVVRRAKAKYVLGLSATVARQDGHHPIVLMQCGPVRHRDDTKRRAAAHPFRHAVHVRPTLFRPLKAAHQDARTEFHDLYEELVADEARNRLICDDVVQAVGEDRSPLVLTDATPISIAWPADCPPPSATWSCFAAACASKQSAPRSIVWQPFPKMRAACCWRPAGTPEKASTTPGWIPCS